MTKKAKALSTVLQDALIDISKNDPRESRELLSAAGIDSDRVIQSSLSKIEQLKKKFEGGLSAEKNHDLLKDLQLKIKDFAVRSPERARVFLNTYFQERSLPVVYAQKTGISKKGLEKLKEKMVLEELSKKIDDEVSR